ncbi:MAG: hypothetical protein U0792_24340 [Gemmataceae bacterium]
MEIGFDAAEKVKQYLDGFDTETLKITYDPANVMLHGHVRGLTPLKGYLTSPRPRCP